MCPCFVLSHFRVPELHIGGFFSMESFIQLSAQLGSLLTLGTTIFLSIFYLTGFYENKNQKLKFLEDWQNINNNLLLP